MDFVSNIWKKQPFKSEGGEESSKESKEDGDDASSKDKSNSGGVSGRVSFLTGGVSNILKSTFKSNEPIESELKEAKESGEENQAETPKDAGSSGGFMLNVMSKTTSLFKSEGGDRKKSVGSDAEKDEASVSATGIGSSVSSAASGATSFMSSVLTKGTSLFKSDTIEKTDEETEEKVEGIEGEVLEGVSQKAIGSAKNIGNFIYSVANKAGHTVTSTAKHIKETVEHNTLFTDFTKEQQDFIKQHGGNIQIGEAPWVGCENEEETKKEILSLSQDKRNFVRAPPSGVQFDFDMQTMLPVALSLLKLDDNLGKMRFEIVPKLVNEESFWRNYFYRVELTKQSTSLGNMEKHKSGYASSSGSSEGPDDVSPTNADPEFVSDTFQGNLTAEDFRTGMKELGVGKRQSKEKDDKQWEEELTKELQEFEVVSSDVNTDLNDELEKDLAGM